MDLCWGGAGKLRSCRVSALDEAWSDEGLSAPALVFNVNHQLFGPTKIQKPPTVGGCPWLDAIVFSSNRLLVVFENSSRSLCRGVECRIRTNLAGLAVGSEAKEASKMADQEHPPTDEAAYGEEEAAHHEEVYGEEEATEHHDEEGAQHYYVPPPTQIHIPSFLAGTSFRRAWLHSCGVV